MRLRPLGGTGLVVSELGFGCSSLGGMFGPIDEREGIATVREAVDRGITLFDVAPYYGDAEVMLGRALAGIARDRYVVCTKVGRYAAAEFDFSRARIRASVIESIARLHSGHLDIVLCHDVEHATAAQIVDEAVPALRELAREGLVRAVGISALPIAVLQELIDRVELDVVLSYGHYNLYDTTASRLALRDTALVLAAPLGMGLLSDAGPPAWHPAPAPLRAACARAARHCRARGAELARVALGYALSGSPAVTTVVGMKTRDELARNVAAMSAPIDPALLGELDAELAAVRDTTWPSGRHAG